MHDSVKPKLYGNLNNKEIIIVTSSVKIMLWTKLGSTLHFSIQDKVLIVYKSQLLFLEWNISSKAATFHSEVNLKLTCGGLNTIV